MGAHLSLVGRAPEQRIISAMLAGAVDGGAALVIRGAAGVGKSALLEWAAVTGGSEFRVLRAVGSVSEFGLPYAALYQLLRPAFGFRNRLTAHYRLALEVAFGQASGASPDPGTVGMAALELLAETGVERPVLVLADDVQWMDPASQQALAFVARRVAEDRVVVLMTLRESDPGSFGDETIASLDLAPLDARSSEQLLDGVDHGLDAGSRRLLLDAACGNPLALLELPRTVGFAAGADTGSLSLTARLERSFLARVGEFDLVTQTVLQVAALSDADDVGEIMAAVELLTGLPSSLDPAVRAGLIQVEKASVRFRHPLIRSAVLQRMDLDRRRETHTALAHVLRGWPERAVWHSAAAALRPDAALAARLELHAEQAITRGSPVHAVLALERAAQLSTEHRERAERTYRAAELAYGVGRFEAGERLRERYRDLADGEHELLRLEWLNELSGGDHGGEQRITALVDVAARAAVIGDIELAADFLRASALRCWNLLPGSAVGREVIAAADGLAICDLTTRVQLLAYGSPFDSDAMVRALIIEAQASVRDTVTTYRLAHAAACAGAFDLSDGLLGEAAERLRAEGQLFTLGRALSLLAWTALRRGHWSQAVAAAAESTRLCAETRQPFWEASSLVAHALVAAFQGEFSAAEEMLADAARMDPRRFATITAITVITRAAIASGQGRHDQAFTLLARLHDPADDAYHPAHALWSLASLAEAAAACGETSAARSLLAGMRPDVLATTSPTGRMNLGFAQAVLATDDAEARFTEALDLDMTTWPYERYRLLFAYGKVLRRTRRVRESREYLRKAVDGFDALGARPLAERAREELRAAGERSGSRAADVWDSLSPQEIQIAMMVAQGLSNREIAKALFISYRTVGSHLYRMFPKLGVTSRGEVQRLAADHGF